MCFRGIGLGSPIIGWLFFCLYLLHVLAQTLKSNLSEAEELPIYYRSLNPFACCTGILYRQTPGQLVWENAAEIIEKAAFADGLVFPVAVLLHDILLI